MVGESDDEMSLDEWDSLIEELEQDVGRNRNEREIKYLDVYEMASRESFRLFAKPIPDRSYDMDVRGLDD